MKETPILFSTPMVNAIQEGRTTQIRRVIKPQPTEAGLELATACGGEFSAWQDAGLNLDEHSEDGGPCHRLCPYGQVGDRLWVRETWKKYNCGELIIYKADGDLSTGLPWKPSIFMPKKYARIWLEITGIRVERVQDITAYDVVSEGAYPDTGCGFSAELATDARMSFKKLWDSINGKTYPWASNPWVWCIEFKEVGK